MQIAWGMRIHVALHFGRVCVMKLLLLCRHGVTVHEVLRLYETHVSL